VVNLSNIKHRLEELAEDVIAGKVDRANAAVAGQLLNFAVGTIRAGLKAKEVEELEGQLEELREMVERDAGRGEARRSSWAT
jgi:HAMP domain-containing protein